LADEGEAAVVLEGPGEAGDAIGLDAKRPAEELGDARVRGLGARVVERRILLRHARGERPAERGEVSFDSVDVVERHRTSWASGDQGAIGRPRRKRSLVAATACEIRPCRYGSVSTRSRIGQFSFWFDRSMRIPVRRTAPARRS